MQADEAEDQRFAGFVQFGEVVAQPIADEASEGAEEAAVIVGEETGAHLQAQHAENGQHREGAQGIVAEAMPLAAQIGLDGLRPFDEGAEAGVGGADKAPDDTEHQQPEDEQANAAMPFHFVGAFGDEGAGDARHQQPVKESGRQIPEFDACHVIDLLECTRGSEEPRD